MLLKEVFSDDLAAFKIHRRYSTFGHFRILLIMASEGN